MFSVGMTERVRAFVPSPVKVEQSKVSTSVAALSSRFARDERGATAMIFGFMVLPCMMLVGMAVDYSRMVSVQGRTQGILDNAALSAANAAMAAGNDKSAIAIEAATAFFDGHTVRHAVKSEMQAVPIKDGKQVELTATQWVATPFMSLAEVVNSKALTAEQLRIPGCQTSGWACQKVKVKATAILDNGGTNSGYNIETALMLDVTGSMAGEPIAALKVAAQELIDIMVWEDQSGTSKSRIALIPFADAVNVGSEMVDAVRGPVITTPSTNPVINVPGHSNFWFHTDGGSWTEVAVGSHQEEQCNWVRVGSGRNRTWVWQCNMVTVTDYESQWVPNASTLGISNRCVTERTDSSTKYTDAAPSAAYVGRYYTSGCSTYRSSDPTINKFVPLTNDKAALTTAIGKLSTNGSTAGHIGTAWAWYSLSPSWGYLWPSESRPEPYDKAKTRKIAVLMTDGEYNRQYKSGVNDNSISGAPDNGSASDQALQLCAGMKAIGTDIEVFTVGFDLNDTAKDLLRACATTPSHFYDTSTSDGLKMAFRDIATKISKIRLTSSDSRHN